MLVVMAAIGCAVPPVARAQTPPPSSAVRFAAADGVTLFGDLYRAEAPSDAPLILLFHQGGGDARGEYGPLVGRLLGEGYHALAIDQRRGGTRLGGTNRTVAGLADREFRYCDAYADLEAALRFAGDHGFTGPLVAWGSSYSAALALRLGAEHEDRLTAVLAFSPATGSMDECAAEPFAARLTLPVLVLRPASEMEIERVRVQLERFRHHGHDTHVADPGVHGSSLLNAARVGASTEEAWVVVLDFLERALAGKR